MRHLLMDLVMDIYSYFRMVFSAGYGARMCFGIVLSPLGDKV